MPRAFPVLQFPESEDSELNTRDSVKIPATPSRPLVDSPTPEALQMSIAQIQNNPLIDYTTPDLVTLVISDVGILTPSVSLSQLYGELSSQADLHHLSCRVSLIHFYEYLAVELTGICAMLVVESILQIHYLRLYRQQETDKSDTNHSYKDSSTCFAYQRMRTLSCRLVLSCLYCI